MSIISIPSKATMPPKVDSSVKIQEKKNDILIIEDSLATSILIRDFLQKMGYTDFLICNTGQAGIKIFSELVRAGKVPITLLDFHLPDMDAIEIMEYIFDIKPDAKIILETEDTNTEENVKIALRGGVYQYIQKPIRYENLKNVFDTLESEKRILEENQGVDNTENVVSYLKSSSRISLARLSEYSQIETDQVKRYLSNLENEKKIMKIEDIKEIACNKCSSVRITHNFFCPSCNSTNFKQGKFIDHFKCGNVSIEESYEENICPKCNKEIKIIGVDYKTIENHYLCNDCKDNFSEPSQDDVCMECNNRFTLDKAKWMSSEGYKTINL